MNSLSAIFKIPDSFLLTEFKYEQHSFSNNLFFGQFGSLFTVILLAVIENFTQKLPCSAQFSSARLDQF